MSITGGPGCSLVTGLAFPMRVGRLNHRRSGSFFCIYCIRIIQKVKRERESEKERERERERESEKERDIYRERERERERERFLLHREAIVRFLLYRQERTPPLATGRSFYLRCREERDSFSISLSIEERHSLLSVVKKTVSCP